jgi:hypothetical protein
MRGFLSRHLASSFSESNLSLEIQGNVGKSTTICRLKFKFVRHPSVFHARDPSVYIRNSNPDEGALDRFPDSDINYSEDKNY